MDTVTITEFIDSKSKLLQLQVIGCSGLLDW